MSNKVTLFIDQKEITAPAGEKVLWAALENEIYIPNLCAIKEIERPPASCRLCFVEIEGEDSPVTSCTREVKEGMVVHTRSEKVDRLVQTAFELLLSDHRLQCGKCPKNRSCALQTIAKKRGLKLKNTRLPSLERETKIDESPETFSLDRSRCVLCGRCVWADRHLAETGALGFSRRSIDRSITTFEDRPLSETPCNECGKCVEVCPVGALYFK